MQKVLILTYHFPPLNMTAALRAFAWAKYFSEFGLEPTVVCRNWEENPAEEVKYVKEETYEVYKVSAQNPPLSGWLKDNNKLKRVFSGYVDKVLEFHNSFRTDTYPIYKQSVKLLGTEKFKSVLVVAEPFVLFKYGYLLHKQFNIDWVADYRDDWNTTEKRMGSVNRLIQPHLQRSNRNKERLYINSTAFFTSVSEPYVRKIEALTGKKGHVIENGYFDEEMTEPLSDNELYPDFTISHGGTISYGRDPVIFAKGFNKLVEKYSGKLKLKCNLLGAYPFTREHIPNQQLKELIDQYPDNYNLTDRLPREEALAELRKSQMLLIIGLTAIAGAPSSKLYEYIGLRKPVLVCPSDNDIIESTLLKTGQGIICSNTTDVIDKLSIILDHYLDTGKVDVSIDESQIPAYSRRSRAEQLAQLIKAI